jgi:hypothetical protein
MRMIAVIAVSAAISITGARATDIVGTGTRSCGDWAADHRTDGAVAVAEEAWLAGYLSAYNVYNVDYDLNLPDQGARNAWVSNFCRNHPLEGIYQAADQLILELQRRLAARR